MYLEYFGMTSQPFTLLPDPDFLYMSKRHMLAYAMLQYGMYNESGEIIVITGEVGSGKTTLIRKLLRDSGRSSAIGMISYTPAASGDYLKWILNSYNLDYHGKDNVELYQMFSDYLDQQHARKARVTLIIDEAHNLSLSALEELRMLNNLNTDSGQKFQLVISGQPELLENLRSPGLSQFNQRVTLQYHLESLSRQECSDYIRHRLKVAGAHRQIFDITAETLISYYSRGIPRIMNTLCDLALLYAFAEQSPTVTTEIVRQLISDRKAGGLFVDADDEQIAASNVVREAAYF
jgi:general secretion pathway protein A